MRNIKPKTPSNITQTLESVIIDIHDERAAINKVVEDYLVVSNTLRYHLHNSLMTNSELKRGELLRMMERCAEKESALRLVLGVQYK